jgi:uncharacterized membrane protein YoaK (UPF0700 family)
VLGHVFVANMTGNVVFLGFALAGAPGFSITTSALALASFGSGALLGGAIGSRLGEERGRLLSWTAALQSALFAAAVILTAMSASPVSASYRDPLIILLAASMGLQNATARRLAVPDLTTTVLTLTITGTAADSTIAGGKGSTSGRRVISVAAMFMGGLIGALLVVHARIVLPLVAGLAVLVLVAGTAATLGRSHAPWTRA